MTIKHSDHSFEELAAALYAKGLDLGMEKITDKTKWREVVMADNLDHTVHEKISAGSDSDKYGSDAYDEKSGVFAEYKSQAINNKLARNFRQDVKNKKTGARFAPASIVGIYNGAFKEGAIEKYKKIDHFFGVFHNEVNIMIIKVDNEHLTTVLAENKANQKVGKTTNLNSCKINLADTHLYETVYKNEEWFA